MLAPSARRLPMLPVLAALSEPARSIIDSLPTAVPDCSSKRAVVSTWSWSTACERELTSFTLVASVVRKRLPLWMSASNSALDPTAVLLAPATNVPLPGASRTSSAVFAGSSKSWTTSL